MQIVKESLDEGYCDISGRVGDLDHVGMSHRPSPDFCMHSRMTQVIWVA